MLEPASKVCRMPRPRAEKGPKTATRVKPLDTARLRHLRASQIDPWTLSSRGLAQVPQPGLAFQDPSTPKTKAGDQGSKK